MSETAIAHGWPDGETRPLPFGAVLSFLNGSTIGGGGVVAVGELDVGAWRSLALTLDISAGTAEVAITWEWLGDATAAPVTTFTHPADGSTLLVPTLGHKASGVTITGTAGETISYTLAGSNLDTPPGFRVRYVPVTQPAAGAATVTLYTTPDGIDASLVELDFMLFLPARTCSPLGRVGYGVTLRLHDAAGLLYYEFPLIADNLPATYTPTPNDPDKLMRFASNPAQSLVTVFGLVDEGLISYAPGAGGVAYYSVQSIGLAPIVLPAGHSAELFEYVNPGGFGQFQHSPASDPNLQISRAGPGPTDQFSNVRCKVYERPPS